MPVYIVTVLATLLALDLCQGHVWATPAFGLPVYLSFTQNIAVALHGVGNLWLLPTRTLAVEEQFYLVLPLLIVAVPTRWLIQVLLFLVIAAVAFRIGVFGANKMAALSLMPARADVLLSGVIAAWMQRRIDLSHHLLALRVVPLVAACALGMVCLIDRNRLLTIAGPLLLGIGASSFILALTLGAPEGHRFAGCHIASFGKISYPLYLIHQPVNGLLHGLILGGEPDIGTPAQLLLTAAAFVLSVPLARTSWRYLEAPLLAWAKADRKSSTVVPTPRPFAPWSDALGR